MAFSHTVGGTTFTQANFEGNAYSDESTGFPRALRTPTFRQRKIRPKKGRGSYSRGRGGKQRD
jgi:hypothetical protein